MWQSLIWKEWREQRWKLGFGCVLLMAFTFVGLRTRIAQDEGIVGMLTFFGAFLLPVLNAMGLVAAERDEGSLQTLLTLPISPRRIFLVKTAMGAIVAAAPILACAVIALVIAGGREMSSAKLIGLFVLASGTAVAVFLWASVAGVRQPTEARAAVAGIVVLGLWVLTIMIVAIVTNDPFNWILYASPAGLLALSGPADAKTGVVLLQVAIGAGLWFWGARRFARPTKSRE